MRMGSKGERECSPVDEEGGDVSARCRPRGTKIAWFPPPTLPHVGEGPKEAEYRYRWILPTPVRREEGGLSLSIYLLIGSKPGRLGIDWSSESYRVSGGVGSLD